MLKKLLKILPVLLALVFSTIYTSTPVSAVTGADWKAGRIIDDALFTDDTGMTVAEIQAFLNSKVGTGGYDSLPGKCDTFGDLPARPYSNAKRRDYAASIGKSGRFTCLSNYYEVPKISPGPSIPASNYGSDTIPAGAKSAAELIWDAGQRYDINPKVLLVKIQKESAGPLTTDDWPFHSQYTYAMGAHCPDGPNGAECDPNYAGFSLQISESAALLRDYINAMGQSWAPSWYKKPFQVNHILWQVKVKNGVNTNCGGGDVYIENKATAALYTYTPYQPNAAALANLYGTGDYCSAYGNRNFWRIFSDWFGSTQTNIPYAWKLSNQTVFSDSARTKQFNATVTVQPGGKIYARVLAQNMGFQPWVQGSVNVGTSRPQDRNSIFYEPTWLSQQRVAQLMESRVDPGQVGTFLFVMNAPTQPGSYREYFNLVAEGQTWLNDPGLYFDINVVNPTYPISSIDNVLSPGEQLTTGSYMMSQDTQSVLYLRSDGNLVLSSNFDRIIWRTGTSGSGARLAMQTDGNLVIYDSSGAPLWASGTYDNPGAKLALQTDGNLVIYSSSEIPVWSINYTQIPDHLSYVNTELHPAMMFPGQSLETASRKYKFVLQYDSNLVLYSNNEPIWASGTMNRNASHLALQPDGNLVLYDKTGFVIWHTNTTGSGQSKLAIQPDGNLVLYNKLGSTWNTRTSGK